jgi:hypothetical protein
MPLAEALRSTPSGQPRLWLFMRLINRGQKRLTPRGGHPTVATTPSPPHNTTRG